MTAATEPAVSKPADATLCISDLPSLLIGRKDAILTATRDRGAIWVGLLLVFAAALARDYDTVDLSRQPYRLLISPLASLCVALLLYALVRRHPLTVRAFVGLFWLTAPIAFLYAVPYERFLSPINAMRVNLATLAVVAAWRVALMIRIVSVVTGRSGWNSFWLVMLVADLIAAGAALLMPIPVIQLMGGVQLTDAEYLLQDAAVLVRLVTIATLPIWLIGGIVASIKKNLPKAPNVSQSGPTLPAPGATVAALACVFAWLLVLPATQREQRLQTRVDDLMLAGQIEQALLLMTEHKRADFPPAWDPLPRVGWDGPEQPPLLDVVRTIAANPPAEWVREAYVDKFERQWLGMELRWRPENLPAVRDILNRLPEGPELLAKHGDSLAAVPQPEPETPATTRGVQ